MESDSNEKFANLAEMKRPRTPEALAFSYRSLSSVRSLLTAYCLSAARSVISLFSVSVFLPLPHRDGAILSPIFGMLSLLITWILEISTFSITNTIVPKK
ncbi:hypothetical protein CDAR_92041 [Caerostris darwini]|uniref:Uncharacterized protein n=1 Tax=Caerostris darwini TaxID=1538125 RepID=A0AAV4QR63_9ARAC|nr:hypothetical protein CDAR_92041 [Caerostris darwini]